MKLYTGDCLDVLKTLPDNSVVTFKSLIAQKCHCGQVFLVHKNRLKHGRGKTCSKACQSALFSKAAAPRLVLNCCVCKTETLRKAYQVVSRHAFCSRNCQYQGRKLGFINRRKLRPQKTWRRKNICQRCGTQFVWRHAGTEKYCSKKCSHEVMSENARGPNNYFYRNGSSNTKRSFRGFEWDSIRHQIYRRDNWSCRKCGMKCTKLSIACHHITPYKYTQDNSHDNLLTMCSKCHNLVHRRPLDHSQFIQIPEQELKCA